MKEGCVDPAEPAASRKEEALLWVWKESGSFEGWLGRVCMWLRIAEQYILLGACKGSTVVADKVSGMNLWMWREWVIQNSPQLVG